MPARSGAEYVESLRKRAPCVYLGGRRVDDVTAEPVFQEPIRAVAEQYDMQLDPAYREVMTYPSPTTGHPVSTSFLVPYTREELVKKRKHFKLRADHNFGFMGRSPDFMNQFVTGWHLMADRFARAGARFGENATRYYEQTREHDLFLTHMLINPQVDRSKTSAQQEDPFLHLGRVRETADGIVVRGAKMLGTMAPITEEVAVIPFGGVPPGDDAYALAFGIPTNAPGLKFICRETVAPLPRSRFDHPLSSRFEEMDCIAIFEDVLVPWDRVMVDGSPGSAEVINSMGADYGALLNVQTSARMLSQMEIARAVFYGAEAMAQRLASGVWVPGGHGLRAFHLQTGKVYSRFVEIVQTLAAGGFFYAPSEADLANPELRPLLDRYVRGRAGVSAEERIALFKLAWDATGETFAQRMAQYVRFYSGDPIRLTAGFYAQYDKAPLFELVERALGRRDGVPLPITADDPGAPVPYRPHTQGMAGTYAATSLPTSRP
jgi:aromatic ring hydroxylase